MADNLKKKAEIVQTVLNEFGVELNVVQLAASISFCARSRSCSRLYFGSN